jgi:hypothetical protein
MSAAQNTERSGARPADVDAALLLLERMGLTPADLAAAGSPRREVPTFANYVPVVSASVSAVTRAPTGRTGPRCWTDGRRGGWMMSRRRRRSAS